MDRTNLKEEIVSTITNCGYGVNDIAYVTIPDKDYYGEIHYVDQESFFKAAAEIEYSLEDHGYITEIQIVMNDGNFFSRDEEYDWFQFIEVPRKREELEKFDNAVMELFHNYGEPFTNVGSLCYNAPTERCPFTPGIDCMGCPYSAEAEERAMSSDEEDM